MMDYQIVHTFNMFEKQLRAIRVVVDWLAVAHTGDGKHLVMLNGKKLLQYDPRQEVIYLLDGSVYNCRLQTYRRASGVSSWGVLLPHVLRKAVDML